MRQTGEKNAMPITNLNIYQKNKRRNRRHVYPIIFALNKYVKQNYEQLKQTWKNE